MPQHQFQFETLLNQEGKLVEEGYSFSMKKKLPSGKKAVESYHFLNDSCYMEIVLDAPKGVNTIALYDLKRERSCHARWHTASSFQIQIVNESERILHGFFPDFGENGETLHFDLNLEEKKDQAISFASKREDKGNYLYREVEFSLSLNGYLKFGEEQFPLKQTKVFYQLDLNHKKSHSLAYQAYLFEDKHLNCYFAQEGPISPSFAFLNEKPFKLSRAEFKPTLDQLGNVDLKKNWQISFDDESVKISFVAISCFQRKKRFFKKRLRQLSFGYFDGFIILDGKKIYLEHVFGYIDRIVK